MTLQTTRHNPQKTILYKVHISDANSVTPLLFSFAKSSGNSIVSETGETLKIIRPITHVRQHQNTKGFVTMHWKVFGNAVSSGQLDTLPMMSIEMEMGKLVLDLTPKTLIILQEKGIL
jgi:hypothetical protein